MPGHLAMLQSLDEWQDLGRLPASLSSAAVSAASSSGLTNGGDTSRVTEAAQHSNGGTESKAPQLSGPPNTRGAHRSALSRRGSQDGVGRSGAADRDSMMRSARRGEQEARTAADNSEGPGGFYSDRTPMRAKRQVVSPKDPKLQQKMSHIFINKRLTGKDTGRKHSTNLKCSALATESHT